MKGWGPPQASVPPFAIPSSKYHWECPQELAQLQDGWGKAAAPCAIRESLSLLAWGIVDQGAEAAFGDSIQARRLCPGVRDAASS